MAIFKESKSSLRWFLLIVGAFNLYSTFVGRGTFGLTLLDSINFIVYLIFGLIIVYIGINFNSLLQTKSELLIKFFGFDAIWGTVNAFYSYFFGHDEMLGNKLQLGILLLGIVLIWGVIITSIKRLAKENA